MVNLRTLDDRNKAREKLPVWYGSNENFEHGLREVLINSSDEINNNYESNGVITVELFDDLKTIQVTDTGRGIPLVGETDGVKNYEILFEILFGSGKYDTEDDEDTGTNGVGTTVLNYTSELFEVQSFKDGIGHSVKYTDGGQNREFKEINNPLNIEHGSIVTFKLDEKVYTNTIYNVERVKEIALNTAVTSNKFKIVFKHKEIVQEFFYDSINDRFIELLDKKDTSQYIRGYDEFTTNFTQIDQEKIEKNRIEIVFATSTNNFGHSYLNGTHLIEGGTIDDGVISGIKLFFNHHCKGNKGFKPFVNSDIVDSFAYVVNFKTNNVSFKGQTKFATGHRQYREDISNLVKELLYVESQTNPKNIEKMIKHIEEIQKHNSANQKAKNKIKKKLSEPVDSILSSVEGLVDSIKHGEESEIYICEGDSAHGSVCLARDGEFQASFPLRGKILNCLKANITTVLSNEVIQSIIRAIGVGIETDKGKKQFGDFDMDRKRYGKLVIACDMDEDGKHIIALILTMFYKLIPSYLKEGRVYIARTPLYEVLFKDDTVKYFYSENEHNIEAPKLKNVKTISRCKGLGELDKEVMSECAMNPETRYLTQVKVEDVEKMVKAFDVWLDDDVSKRKEYIENHLLDFVHDL